MKILSTDGNQYNGTIISQDETGLVLSLGKDLMARLITTQYSSDFHHKEFTENLKLATCWGNCREFAIPISWISTPNQGFVFYGIDNGASLSTFINKREKPVKDFMSETGDTKRRISILINIARILNHLHMSGLCASVVSLESFIVSKNVDSILVFFASTEWARYKSSPLKARYACDYAMPNLKEGRIANSWATDMYAFAIISYEILTMKYHNGKISEKDISESEFIPNEVKSLLNDTLINGCPHQASEWKEVLTETLPMLSLCPDCDLFLPSESGLCPLCGHKRECQCKLASYQWGKTIVFKDYVLREGFGVSHNPIHKIYLDKDIGVNIPKKWLDETLGGEDALFVKLRKEGNSAFLYMKPLNGLPIYISLKEGETLKTDKEVMFRLMSKERFIIGIRPATEDQIVIIIDSKTCQN